MSYLTGGPLDFAYDPGSRRYVVEVGDTAYRLERLRPSPREPDIDPLGWYLSGGGQHQEWCGSTITAAYVAANLIITEGEA